VGCSETGDLRGLIGVLTEQQTQLKATIDQLRTGFTNLKEKYDTLVASTTAQHHAEAQWQRETTEHLQSLAGRRRLTSAVSTKRRRLSSDTCGDPNGPELRVEGVCSCTGGLSVQGRNVTRELDLLQQRQPTTPEVTTSMSTTTLPTTCSVLDHLVIVGSIVDSLNFNGSYGLAVSPDAKYTYVVNSKGNSLVVVDVGSDPTRPAVVGSVIDDGAIMSNPIEVAVSPDGKYAYVASSDTDTLAVVDVGSNASKPVIIGATLANSTLMDHPFDVAVSPDGAYVFVVSSASSSLAVVDVSRDPSNPVIVGGVVSDTMSRAAGVAVSPDGNHVYVACIGSESLVVVSVANGPHNPTIVGATTSNSTTMEWARGVAVSPDGNTVYVSAGHSDSLTVVDVGSDKTKPSVVSSILGDATNTSGAYHLSLSEDGNFVLLAGAWPDSLAVVDVTTNARNPTVVGFIANATYMHRPYMAVNLPGSNYAVATGYDSNSLAVIQWRNCSIV